MGKTMFAWIGGHDFDAATGTGSGELGPIASAAIEINFSKIVLLNNYGPERNAQSYMAWLMDQCQSQVDVVPISLSSPVDFAAIYVSAKAEVEKTLKSGGGQAIPVFHLSPGTPAMAAVWIMLAKGAFPEAELIQTSINRGVEQVEMPFNIFTEFIPDAIMGADKKLIGLSAGPLPTASEFTAIVHQCEAMKRLVAQARLVARRNVPVLLEGETGTGKELFARAIHKESPRSSKPFVAVNCGAIPRELFEAEFFGYMKGAFTGAIKDRPGYFEQANGGTLFLDELGELPPEAQVKILRVLNDGMVRRLNSLSEQSVDVRIIAATNCDLLREVARGKFRADLFYRVAVAMLKLPPLREREGDLSLLLESILSQVNERLASEPDYKDKKFSVNAKNIMVRHSWPGNAREMFNTILRICVWCQGVIIQEDDVSQALLPNAIEQNDDILQKPLGNGFKLQEIQDVISSHYIHRAIHEAGGNRSKAARLLGVNNYQTLSNWMKNLGISE